MVTVCKVVLEGDTFDDSYKASKAFCEKQNKTFVHPFDDPKTIEGQATIGLELLNQSKDVIDYVFVAVGGGGLASGLCATFKAMSPKTKIIGVEPAGAPSMTKSIEKGELVELSQIDKFVDGAAVQKVGAYTFPICREHLYKMETVPEGKVCQTILELYNRDAIVVEPAGALTIAALDEFPGRNTG